MENFKSKDFVTYASTPDAVERAVKFLLNNFVQENLDGSTTAIEQDVLNEFKWHLIGIVRATSNDIANANNKLTRNFTDSLIDDITIK